MEQADNSKRIISSLRGLVNDQFYSLIRFCLNLPYGGKELAEQMLRELAQLHSASSLESEAYKSTYKSPPPDMSAAQSLSYIFEIHVKEGVIKNGWAVVAEREGCVEVAYDRDNCVYNGHCNQLVCDGLECICVRRFFCEGIVKQFTGIDYDSHLNTPALDEPMCRFTLSEAADRRDRVEKVISELESSMEDNLKLNEAVKAKTEVLEMQKKAILERESQISAITSSTIDAIVMIDQDGIITFLNPAAERMFGIVKSKSLGKLASDLVIPSGNVEKFNAALVMLSSGDAPDTFDEPFEALAVRNNGEVFPVEVSVSTLLTGGKWNAITVIRDVTERKKAEMALKQLIKDTSKTTGEDFFKTIAKSLNRLLGVGYSFISVIAGHEEKILETVIFCKVDEILPNFQYGYEGTPCEILISEKRFVCFSGNVAQTFPKDEWLSINNIESYAAIPLFDSRGKFLGHMGVMDSKQFDSSDLNISIMKTFAGRISSEIEREETERERSRLDLKIQQTQKLESLGLLSGGIAHDFNNLLTAIVGDCDLVMEELEAGSASYGRIAEIKNAARQAAELSHQMLVYSGRGKIRISPINLNDILKEMSYLIERSTSKKVSVEFHLEEGLPLIMADVVQVRQVILNLAINASEAIGGGQGAISISTSSSECDSQCLRNTYLKEDMKEGLYVSMKVSDTGAGMDSDSISKIFDPFFTTKFKGRGLGLSAILGIIRKHKAAIKVESQVGRGTTFNILFPCASAPKIETPSASAEVQEPHPASGLALVVDDEEVVRNVAVKMFELMGFTAISAVNGIEALGIFKEKHDEISLILLDLTMPQMDGLECLTAIREIDKVVHIIISSGYDKSEVDQLLEGKGASGFLQKPFDMKMIRDVVKKVYEDALPQPGP